MSEGRNKVSIRIKKSMKNPLLARRQFVVDITHSATKSLSKEELKGKIGTMLKVNDLNTIVPFGFRTVFGGGRTTGFCKIYDTMQDLKKFEPRFTLVRLKLKNRIQRTRKQVKERKNRANKVRGKERVKILYKGGSDKKE